MSDQLDAGRLRTVLGARPYRFERQIGSTNDVAREWALKGAPHGSVVVADEQVAGRGRFGRPWSAPPGTALLMSVILRVNNTQVQRLTMLGAVAVAEALDPIVPGQVRLKWPNDVLLAGRKVAGILPEAIWQSDKIMAVVLGMGINVRVDFAATPLDGRAVSVEPVAGRAVNRAELLAAVLARIDYWMIRIAALHETWRRRLSTLGQQVTVRAENSTIVGQALDVDENGALILQALDGTIHQIIAGEVTLSG